MNYRNALSLTSTRASAGGHAGLFAPLLSDSSGPALGSFLTYHINVDLPGQLYADVRDAYGKPVFEIDGHESLVGVMANAHDLVGLKQHLVSAGVMGPMQELVMG